MKLATTDGSRYGTLELYTYTIIYICSYPIASQDSFLFNASMAVSFAELLKNSVHSKEVAFHAFLKQLIKKKIMNKFSRREPMNKRFPDLPFRTTGGF